jgi:hypothetical protein
LCRPPRIPANLEERTARRSLPATFVGGVQLDKADKSQSSRHIPCAVHLESLQILKSGRHDGACLLLLSAVSSYLRKKWCVPRGFRKKVVCPRGVEEKWRVPRGFAICREFSPKTRNNCFIGYGKRLE